MKPSIGRIVHYVLSGSDAEQINRRRVNGVGHGEGWPAGAQAHVGNPVASGHVFPMIVVRVKYEETDTISGQVILDGNDTLWKPTVLPGTSDGTWRWPERV